MALGSLFPSTLWPSLSCCKVSVASSSSSTVFPSLICGVVHLKVPSGPKLVVKIEFLFLPLPNIHSLLSLQPQETCVFFSVALLGRFGLTLTHLWALPAQPDLSYTIVGDAMSLGLGLSLVQVILVSFDLILTLICSSCTAFSTKHWCSFTDLQSLSQPCWWSPTPTEVLLHRHSLQISWLSVKNISSLFSSFPLLNPLTREGGLD